ncbi:MAG: SPOR domain-containing protein [Clostridium sulfidigenes]|uniref:SPOR domain-containing protein n=1 Tax=Clostridium sulfidigenes TaxID=318464 RepID=A0A927ZL97_9CLOT|nr:SPOR domain-containing protein [Clostridium sulfidigenes]
MKYTRYNIKSKPKSSNSFLFYLAITLLLALLLGTFIFKFVLKDSGKIGFIKGIDMNNSQQQQNSGKVPGKSEVKEEGNSNGIKEEKAVSEYNFYILQCGVFKVKSNADETLNKLSAFGNPFIGQEGELSKVYFGMYSDKNIENGASILKEKGIDNTKVTINIPMEDNSTKQFCEIVDSLLQVVNKTSESGVKSINTSELKKWIDGLEKIDENMKQYNEVNSLKEYIKALPDEVDKNKDGEVLKYVYDQLIKFKK